jgi:hypothetical protein
VRPDPQSVHNDFACKNNEEMPTAASKAMKRRGPVWKTKFSSTSPFSATSVPAHWLHYIPKQNFGFPAVTNQVAWAFTKTDLDLFITVNTTNMFVVLTVINKYNTLI